MNMDNSHQMGSTHSKGHHTPHLGQFSILSAILTKGVGKHHNLKWQTTVPDTIPDVVYGRLKKSFYNRIVI